MFTISIKKILAKGLCCITVPSGVFLQLILFSQLLNFLLSEAGVLGDFSIGSLARNMFRAVRRSAFFSPSSRPALYHSARDTLISVL